MTEKNIATQDVSPPAAVVPPTEVVTRFAPSPTGALHIGGARTALFNFLYAKSMNGKFLLRIDDTDHARSSDIYRDNIIDTLNWLGMTWDNQNNVVYQSTRTQLYHAAVDQLLSSGKAYKCYATEEDDTRIRELQSLSNGAGNNMSEKKLALRECSGATNYTVRFKMDLEGEFVVHDTIAGDISMKYENLDDFVLLRQDGNPTYMLASVVDDEEMGITNIIRGAEHLSNTYRQIPLMRALQYSLPIYTHIPLINNPDGKKLSKRDDATSVYEYEQMGILPEALCNYMLRLGWGQGNTDIITMDDAKHIFSLDGLRPSSARFDMDKLLSLNAHYMKKLSSDELIHKLHTQTLGLPENILPKVRICLDNMVEKANTLKYIVDMSKQIFGSNTVNRIDKLPILNGQELKFLQNFESHWNEINCNSADEIKTSINNLLENFASGQNLDKKNIFMFLRISLTGMKVSPGLFEIMQALEKKTIMQRISSALEEIIS